MNASELAAHAQAAAAGDRDAARAVLEAVRDDVYHLALRMLGHPADAEDAAQEILIIVLTHLGAFRGESAFRTWVWRIAARQLARIRRGRRETVSLEALDEGLRGGLREPDDSESDPENEAIARELRLRCTQAMLLGLDRELRLAYILGDILNLRGDEAAEVLEIEEAAYRKRLSRARARLHAFLRSWCGVYDAANPCRCAGQVAGAVAGGLIAPTDLYLSKHRARPAAAFDRAADEVGELMRVAEVMRGPTAYLAPEAMLTDLRALLDGDRLELLR